MNLPGAAKLGPSLWPDNQALNGILDRVMAKPNVIGAFIGHKQTCGTTTEIPSIVCWVSAKKPLARLPRRGRVPRVIHWTTPHGRRRRIMTDVQVGQPGNEALAPVLGPGDRLLRSNHPAVHAPVSLGAAFQHPEYGPVVSTAGHVILQGVGSATFVAGNEPRVHVRNVGGGSRRTFQAALVKAVRTAHADYALLRPISTTPSNLYRDSFPLRTAGEANEADVGRTFLALTQHGAQRAELKAVEGRVPVAGLLRKRVLITDYVTQGGDSGCALIDLSGRIIGFLIGGALRDGVACSVFMPALPLIANERSTLL